MHKILQNWNHIPDEVLSGEDDFNLVAKFYGSLSHGCKYDAEVPITKFIFVI